MKLKHHISALDSQVAFEFFCSEGSHSSNNKNVSLRVL